MMNSCFKKRLNALKIALVSLISLGCLITFIVSLAGLIPDKPVLQYLLAFGYNLIIISVIKEVVLELRNPSENGNSHEGKKSK